MKVWGDESRVRASAWRRVMALAIGAALAMVAIGPAPAAAQTTFQWRDVENGNWPDAGNWLRTNGPDNGFGYPRGNGDVAIFTGAYSGPQTLLVPANFTVLVGEIIHTAAVNVTIAADTGGQISLVPLAGANAQISVSGNVILSFNIPMNLGATVNVSVTTGTVRMNAPVSGNATAGLVKVGTGGLLLGGTNTYAGTTTVREGGVSLAALLGGAIPGPLVIGDDAGGPQSARVTVGAPDQIADAAKVTVLRDGLFNVSAPDAVGELAIATGTAVSDAGGVLTMSRLTMTGGVLESTNNGLLVLSGDVAATSNATTQALIRRNGGSGTLSLLDAPRTFTVDDGPNPDVLADLEIGLRIIGTGPAAGLSKTGTGTLRFSGQQSSTYAGETVVRRGLVEDVRGSVLWAVGNLRVGTGEGPAEFRALRTSLSGLNPPVLSVGGDGLLMVVGTDAAPDRLSIADGGRVVVQRTSAQTSLSPRFLEMTGGRITLLDAPLFVRGELIATSSTQTSVIEGGLLLFLSPVDGIVHVNDGPQPVDLRIDAGITVQASDTVVKRGAGIALLTGVGDGTGKVTVAEGTLLVNLVLADASFQLTGGTLGGTGTLGPLAASGGRLSPGVSPGRLTSGPVALTAGATFAVELTGTTPGSGYDQLVVNGSVDLGNAALAIAIGGPLPPLATFTVLVNDGVDPITGTFAGLPEGASVQVGSHTFSISYAGGSGNDVVLTNGGDDDDGEETPVTYLLAEGATGAFFDEDLLIANPNDAEAPVTLTFLQEGGNTIVERRTLAPQSRMTVKVEEIAGLEETSASVQVTSDDRLPLIVERSMFWDQTYYGGHTANAVGQPERRWILAEGAQGTFDTYILIANPNPEPVTATLTFLREQEGPFVATVPVAPFARETVYAGDYPEVVNRAFGVVVDTTEPVMVERAMYFATLPGKLWGGGHVNTGIVAPSTSWFHAEGATGGFFFTFILLSNPQDTPAQVDLQFLLPTGDVITKTKTLKALERLTINPAEEDPRLRDAALSTVVQSDVPIVSERSMYWRGDAEPFGEGHNSTGVVSAGTRWGLAEGRIGGPQAFDTFILLANPSTTAAEVTVTYLRETGAPIVQTHVVPPTSRFNIDVKDFVPELRDSSFGARIEVTNGVPIAVERSMYWDANGIFWAGGTNALATPLP